MGRPIENDSGVQVRSDILNDVDVPSFVEAGRPREDEHNRTRSKQKRRGYWRERDLQRVLGVVKRARVGPCAVQVSDDGTITVLVGLDQKAIARL